MVLPALTPRDEEMGTGTDGLPEVNWQPVSLYVNNHNNNTQTHMNMNMNMNIHSRYLLIISITLTWAKSPPLELP